MTLTAKHLRDLRRYLSVSSDNLQDAAERISPILPDVAGERCYVPSGRLSLRRPNPKPYWASDLRCRSPV
jgi:hypothetical protein